MKKTLFLCVGIFLFLLARKKSDVFALDKSIRIGLESQKDIMIKNKIIPTTIQIQICELASNNKFIIIISPLQ